MSERPDPTIGDVHETVNLIAQHLVPFLKGQQQVAGLNERIAVLEKEKAARAERPLITAVARTLATVRRMNLDETTTESITSELVAGLHRSGCVEFQPEPGDEFNPDLHHVVAGDGTGTFVTVVHTAGVRCETEVLVRSDVSVGALPTQANSGGLEIPVPGTFGETNV